MKKYGFLVLTLCLLLALTAGCGQQPTGSSPPAESPAPGEQDATTDSVYIILGGSLAGSWEQGAWRSLNDVNGDPDGQSGLFLFADLLSADLYTLYQRDVPAASTTRLLLSIDQGVGGFDNEIDGQTLAACGELTEDGSAAGFDLPATLSNECASLAVPEYGYYIGVGPEQTDLALSAPVAALPRPFNWQAEATEADGAELQRYLQEQNIEAETNFSDVVSGDFDNDGSEEALLLANSKVDETGWPAATEEQIAGDGGTYALALLRESDGSYTTLAAESHRFDGAMDGPLQCYRLEPIGVFDLNGDGVCELCLRSRGWEWGYVMALARNDEGQYEIVLRANYGL